MTSSSFLGQRRSSSIPGSQLLVRICISGGQFKFIWVWLEFLLRVTWWRMEFTFPRMDYHQLPTLARLAFRRSATSFMFLHKIHQLKLLKAYLVGIQRWIFYWSNCGYSHRSTEYLAAMSLLIKPWFYLPAGQFTLQRCQTSQLVKDISFSVWQRKAISGSSSNHRMQLEGILLMLNPVGYSLQTLERWVTTWLDVSTKGIESSPSMYTWTTSSQHNICWQSFVRWG